MEGISIVTKISTALGLLGLITFIVLHFFRSQQSFLKNPQLLELLLSIGISKEQIANMDKETVLAILDQKGKSNERVAKMLVSNEVRHQEKLAIYFSVLMLCIAGLGIFSQAIKADNKQGDAIKASENKKLYGTVFSNGIPSPEIEIKLEKYNKRDETNKRGEFLIDMDDVHDNDSVYKLRFRTLDVQRYKDKLLDTAFLWKVNAAQQIDLSLPEKRASLQQSDTIANGKGKPYKPHIVIGPVLDDLRASAKDIDVRGVIKDRADQPVANVDIYFGDLLVAKSDETGSFSFKKKNATSNDELTIILKKGATFQEASVGRIQHNAHIIL